MIVAMSADPVFPEEVTHPADLLVMVKRVSVSERA